MKVGDLVQRKIRDEYYLRQADIQQKKRLGIGIVVSKYRDGDPEHPCVIVYYSKVGASYGIAESLLEVI